MCAPMGGHVSCGRPNTYDFLRLLAALAVVVQHSTAHLDANFLWHQPDGAWWFYDGVPAFFIISGLFVFRSAERLHQIRAGWSAFYVNRLLRVAPAIYTYLAITVILLLVLDVVGVAGLVSVQGAGWIGSTLMLVPVYSPDFLRGFGIGVINGSLWTIPVECSFYVIVPLLVLAANRAGHWFLPSLGVGSGVLFLASAAVPGMAGKLLGITFVPYLWYFTIGICWHYLRTRVYLRWPLALACSCVYVLIAFAGNSGVKHLPLSMISAVVLSYVIVCVGERGPTVFARLTIRIGDLSFGTYIWHMVVVNTLLWTGARSHMPGQAAVLLTILVTLILAWLSHRFVEAPALAKKRATSREAGNSDLPDLLT